MARNLHYIRGGKKKKEKKKQAIEKYELRLNNFRNFQLLPPTSADINKTCVRVYFR